MPGAFSYNPSTTKKGSAFQGPASGLVYSFSDAAPKNPTPGDMWFDSNNAALLIYITDASGSQWVEIGNSGVSNPVGTIIPFAGASSPSGFLLCDGTSVSSSNYLALHSVISNTYGGSAYTGAAALSFNLPDYRGRVLIGAGTGSGLTTRTLGGTVGAETHTLASTNIPQMTSGTMSTNASHTHSGFAHPLLKYVGSGGNRADLAGGTIWIGTDSSPTTVNSQGTDHTHTVGTASPTSVSNLQPSIGINYLIKT